jgi:hypothetical protein
MNSESYRALVAKLAQAQARYATERQQAQREYETTCAAAAATLQETGAAVARAAAGAREAAGAVEQVDTDAAQLWQAVRQQSPSRLRRRLGVPPEPTARPAEPQPADGPLDEPAAARHLAAAREIVSSARRRAPLPWHAYVLLAFLGALVGALGYLAARGILVAGHAVHGPPGVVLTAVGQVGAFGAPLAGLPVAKLYADRLGAHLEAAAVGLVVLSGVLVATGLTLARPW